jgi:hypothetical protein
MYFLNGLKQLFVIANFGLNYFDFSANVLYVTPLHTARLAISFRRECFWDKFACHPASHGPLKYLSRLTAGMPECLPARLPARPYACPPACLPACLSVCLSVCLSAFEQTNNFFLLHQLRGTACNDQRSTDLYYLTWRNYQSLMLSAVCGRGEDRTHYLSACSPTQCEVTRRFHSP